MQTKMKTTLFCNSLFQYKRAGTSEVTVGTKKIGGDNPVLIQSMTNTNTMDTDSTVKQCIDIFEACGEIVRITAQGQREAKNLAVIREKIRQKGYNFPLVADIHFNRSVALAAAGNVEKVRINPGNFVDGPKKLQKVDYNEEAFISGKDNLKSKLLPFLETCRKNDTAIRIGANHGSLSDRIMSRYGDTPEGLVESCMEYLRICKEVNFNNIVLSIKSSNTRVMVQSVRLLAAAMKSENMNFPFHLGVTEAGSGEDGRVKSAVGIGALLADGIGDTIRVSLTEPPENEIPVAKILVNHFKSFENHAPIEPILHLSYTPYKYTKRISHGVLSFGGENQPQVVANLRDKKSADNFKTQPDAIIADNYLHIKSESLVIYKKSEISAVTSIEPIVLQLSYNDLDMDTIDFLRRQKNTIILLTTENTNGIGEQRAFFLKMNNFELTHPVIIHRIYDTDDEEVFRIKSACDTGVLFLDGFGDGISLYAPMIDSEMVIDTHFTILQASRARFSKTEYISCPGCGRTLFDLQAIERKIRERTSHLKGLKIAVMGCIVNGLGEMADADYGYVGAAAGKISLFKNRELIAKNIPEKNGVDMLVDLIKKSGDWIKK